MSLLISCQRNNTVKKNVVSGYTYETFFEKYYQNSDKTVNGWESTIDENAPLMIPNKKSLKGKYMF